MQTIFDHGEYQDILAVLKNKDERVKIQNQLLKTNPSMRSEERRVGKECH